MRQIHTTKVFVSAERREHTLAHNSTQTCELSCDLALLDGVEAFREVNSRFGGYHETAFCCFLRPGSILETIDEIRELAGNYSQDSILVVHGDNAAELVEVDTEASAIIGRFQTTDTLHVGEDYPECDGVYYVVR